jgi:hypothetical protein
MYQCNNDFNEILLHWYIDKLVNCTYEQMER